MLILVKHGVSVQLVLSWPHSQMPASQFQAELPAARQSHVSHGADRAEDLRGEREGAFH